MMDIKNGIEGEGQLVLAMIIKFAETNRPVHGLSINPVQVS